MRYYLVHNEIDVFLYGKLEEGQELESGQPFLEFFDDLENLIDRLSYFGLEYKNELVNNELDFFGEESDSSY